jgi:Alginate export
MISFASARAIGLVLAATTLPIASAGTAELPSATVGDLTLRPTLQLDLAWFAQRNSWYGRSTANLGRNSDRWWEGAATPGLDASLDLHGAGSLYGRLSMVGAFTRGIDAAGTNVDDDTPSDVAVDDAYLGWNSGPLLADSLGEEAVDLSFGRQPFELGTGFLFSDGSTEGGERAAYWLDPRQAYDRAGIATVASRGVVGRAFYLTPDDDPDTDTEIAGLDLEHELTEGSCGEDADVVSCLAVGYYNIFNSDIDTRDGMSIFDLRGDARPFAAVPGVRLAGEFAYEKNGDDLEAYGWYGELGYAADDLPWAPYVSYRYAFFSGDDPESEGRSEEFDPLFYSGPDWGTWTQGEIIGEWVLANSNLISHTVRLNAYPTDSLTLTALYYFFRLDDPAAAGVEDHDFAQEIDLVADYVVNDNLSVGVIGATSFPGDAGEEFTGGDSTWSEVILYASVTF